MLTLYRRHLTGTDAKVKPLCAHADKGRTTGGGRFGRPRPRGDGRGIGKDGGERNHVI
jgi:hypothetical protein